MRYIISESQLDMVIPTPLKRRLDGLQELMYDVMMNNGAALDADEYNDVEDFVNYVIDIMMYDIFPLIVLWLIVGHQRQCLSRPMYL